jgi:uncharacterized repeat protein (TIGR03803 family)
VPLAGCDRLRYGVPAKPSRAGSDCLDLQDIAQVPSGAHGRYPLAGLILDGNGALYGTTYQGGGHDLGTVFKLTPPAAGQSEWTETVLHSFEGGTDGANPTAAVLAGASGGALYGTTFGGGPSTSCGSQGCGTAFELTPPAPGATAWTEKVLHNFDGEHGSNPQAGLIADKNGILYGVTVFGGVTVLRVRAPNNGVAFTLTPPATIGGKRTTRVVWTFGGGKQGGNPSTSIMMQANGALYGALESGGDGYGIIYALGTWWVEELQEKVLYKFKGGADGDGPSGQLIMDASGALYGTTVSGGGNDNCDGGCGTVFKLTPPAPGRAAWTKLVIDRFPGNTLGGKPLAGLIMNAGGDLFGTTQGGSVFELVP